MGKKICLSITGFHPEFWQPAWGSTRRAAPRPPQPPTTPLTPSARPFGAVPPRSPVRTVCMALISFFPTKGAGAIGALEYSEAERRAIAKR